MNSILSFDIRFVNLLLWVQIRQPSEESGLAVRVNDILSDIGPGRRANTFAMGSLTSVMVSPLILV